MSNSVLIIDNDTIYTDRLKTKLENNLDVTCTIVEEYDSVEKLENINDHTLYYIRLDEKNDKIIKRLINNDKIVILLTNNEDKETRDIIKQYSANDYIILNSSSNGAVALRIANRLINNKKLTVMIVDDSPSMLKILELTLQSQNLSYVTCRSSKEAWDYINNPITTNVDLIVTDYEMPDMNGYEFTKLIRTKYPIEQLPVLVLSATEDTYMISRLLKVGANDYIPKPFTSEEFIARISNSLTILDMFKKIRDMAMTDHLTGLHNRAYFYQAGEQLLALSRRTSAPLALCMIDIDNFKSLNDTYGHDVGDKALIHVANTIKKTLRKSDILVRFGGEEFIVILSNCKNAQACETMHKITETVAASKFYIDSGEKLKITISSGVNTKLDNLDAMVTNADAYMYKAKRNGKNQVYSEDC